VAAIVAGATDTPVPCVMVGAGTVDVQTMVAALTVTLVVCGS
jgi:spore maturation protein SpmB